MHHKPIQISNISLCFQHKTCFQDFSVQIPYGSRIALIGQNGCGKSSLLKMLYCKFKLDNGKVIIPEEVNFGYVPQIIEAHDNLSGGERFNKTLTQALSLDPNVLILDEPTNHLDQKNRKSLMKMLQVYFGTLIIASHDVELLKNNIDILWHIDNGKVNTFSGSYEDYMNELVIQRLSIKKEMNHLKKQTKEMHENLMKEQGRAAKKRAQGEKSIEQRKWPTVVSKAKVGRANKTTDKIKSSIGHKKQALLDTLSDFRMPEIIVPKFNLSSAYCSDRELLSIRSGSVEYINHEPLLSQITLSVTAQDRLAIMGNNGSGKSTLIKAILGVPNVLRSGEWFCPSLADIGYLDQHYQNFNQDRTVFEIIQECVPGWDPTQIRRFLSDFLFRKNEEVNLVAKHLSGGEKVRLSLALIAAKTPKLLILDEITNNLDLTTREHVIQVLKNYPGAMIFISHDEDFLRQINMTDRYVIKNGKVGRE